MDGGTDVPSEPIARPLVTFPDPALVAEIAAIEAPQPQEHVTFSWPRSIVFALLLAFAGSWLYALVVKLTDAQWGLVSIVIGVLAGLGAARGGRGRKAQIVGAAAAALGYFAAQWLIALLIFGWDVVSRIPIPELLEAIAKDAFTTINALFLAIAVYEGWVIPRARDA